MLFAILFFEIVCQYCLNRL